MPLDIELLGHTALRAGNGADPYIGEHDSATGRVRRQQRPYNAEELVTQRWLLGELLRANGTRAAIVPARGDQEGVGWRFTDHVHWHTAEKCNDYPLGALCEIHGHVTRPRRLGRDNEEGATGGHGDLEAHHR
eukprot:scaffold55596_cov60-Phaeocystis_antarctica.AAC.1